MFLSPPANTGLPPAKRAVQNEEFMVLSSLPEKKVEQCVKSCYAFRSSQHRDTRDTRDTHTGSINHDEALNSNAREEGHGCRWLVARRDVGLTYRSTGIVFSAFLLYWYPSSSSSCSHCVWNRFWLSIVGNGAPFTK